jgi:DMSO/TMAO reductase YedYZ molybdopterin-dependent catalytic subunit
MRAPREAGDQSAWEPQLPPGQYIPHDWPVLHYGPVPRFRPDRWDFRVYGATASGNVHRWTWAELSEVPCVDVTADFHCVTKFTVPDVAWRGIACPWLLEAAPPDSATTHVMVWAEYGYSANLRISDFMRGTSLLATHCGGEPLTPERGFPVRMVAPHLYGWKSVKWVRAIEYLTVDQRGFWEDRGYHNTADPWSEQRYSYQEQA